MALTLSSLLAVPSGSLSPSFEDNALYNTELFSGDLAMMEDHGGKPSNQPLFDDASFLTNDDIWNNEWSALPTIASSTGDIPDLSLFCEPEMDPSLPMATPYTPTAVSPVSPDVVYPSPTSSPPISSPPVLPPVLSPEEQIQNIIMYLEDDAPSSVESTSHTSLVQSPTTPLYTPTLSPTTPLHTSALSPNSSPTSVTVPQKHSLYEEPSESPPSKRSPKKKTPTQKKLRKKEQNKTAALRYRQRKREELQELEGKQQALENVNKKLRSEVNGLEAEIKYLKQLWRDVTSAKRQ